MSLEALIIKAARDLLASRTGNIFNTIQKILLNLSEELCSTRAFVFETSADSDRLVSRVGFHSEEFSDEEGCVVRNKKEFPYLLAEIKTGKPVYISDVKQEKHQVVPELEFLQNKGICGILLCPYMENGELKGLLGFEQDETTLEIRSEMLHSLMLLVDLIFAAIRRENSDRHLSSLDSSYRELFNNVTDPIYIQNEQGLFLDVNQGAVDMYGYPREYFLGKTPEFLSAPDRNDLASVQTCIQKALAGEPQRFEFWGIDRNGREFPKEVSVYPGHYLGNRVTIAYARDISERIRKEKLQRKKDERQREAQKLESLGLLAGGIAHDFNNLLQSILGNTEIVLSDLQMGSTHAECLQDVLRAGNLAADLCRQMLAYSGQGRVVNTRINLGRELQEISRILDVTRLPSTRVEHRVSKIPAVVEADPSQIRQLMMNLLTNAAEAIGQDSGCITLVTEVRHVDPAVLKDSFFTEEKSAGEWACLGVEDTGCGMSEETLSRLFDPFFSTKQLGRGLGLSAVLGIVRGHNGMICVRSKLAEGSSFEVFLPLAGKETTRANRIPVGDEAGLRAGRVLVAEDDTNVQRILSRQLKSMGYQPEFAQSGRRAIELFQQYADDWTLALLDIVMPEGDGMTVLKTIVQRRPKLPVLMITGYHPDSLPQKVDVRPGLRLLQKPFSSEQLGNALKALKDN